jgi:hypothetical protein
LVNPTKVAQADAFFRTTIFGSFFFERTARIRETTTGVAMWHEFGHAWKMWQNIRAASAGTIPGAIGIHPAQRTSDEALRWENRMRQQIYGPLGPNNARRVKHD